MKMRNAVLLRRRRIGYNFRGAGTIGGDRGVDWARYVFAHAFREANTEHVTRLLERHSFESAAASHTNKLFV
jgi:hypothetical protein